MNLMQGERVLMQSASENLILTTHRIRHESESFGQSQIISILLEELASSAMERTSVLLFLVLAALCLGVGLVATAIVAITTSSLGFSIVGLGLSVASAGVFALVYLFTQEQVLTFASAGAMIKISVNEMTAEGARDFLEMTEVAKNTRYLSRD